MFPPTPLSIVCTIIIICIPLAVIFTITAPSSTIPVVSSDGTAAYPLPATTSINTSKRNPATIILPSREPKIMNHSRTNAIYAPPPQPILPEDDQSLYQRASRVDPNPKPVKKVAFMFLTTSSLPLAPLWELFFARASGKLYNIYVHVDPSVNYTKTFHGVFTQRVVPSKPTRRHTPTLISAARRLLAHALLHDKSNSMFALLSPSCIPIHSFNYTYRTLMKSRRSFIEILKKEPGAHERWAARGEEAMVPEVEFEDFRIGSQFWVVTRKHARTIVSDMRVWSKFKLPCLHEDTCYPEEHYFPTLLSMVDLHGCIPCTLTHVDWNSSHGGHPRMYKNSEVGPELIWTLRKARPRYGDELSDESNSSVRKMHDPFLFARKFSSSSLQHLIKLADEVILKE